MPGWDQEVRNRAAKAHKRKKLARRQRQHLEAIKSEKAIRQIVLASRVKQK